ncbi:MAG: homoserine dehydrogenase [Lachnospiraceae bacterium]|nr:homoserine dehydrogenase [Lachnospiraceae bacterium]MCI9675906.1 homoserine dehydrogenase [Lachnospiraceae bacterium]
MIKVAVLGYGTVGSGVVEVIERNNDQVSGSAGEELHVKYILDLRDFPGDPYEDRVVHDINLILEDPEISVVCEVMGGTGAAYQFTKQALEKGKSVCTSNKELVAKHGPELLSLAKEQGCSYLFEASVGGGIPVIRPINSSLTAEKILAVLGIVNGTTNYILTKMSSEGAAFEDVLKQAQEMGYAERNPEADVEGYDACRKLAILSSLMAGKNVDSEKIYTEGITKITTADFEYAKAAGMAIKLLALGRMLEDGRVLAMVSPFFVSNTHPLAMVNDVFNAVFISGNMLGDSMYYGRGAGKLPTASAVVSDVIECARNQGRTISCRWEAGSAELADIAETEYSYFVRVKASARAEAEAVFPGKVFEAPGREDDLGIFTDVMKEKTFREKYATLGDKALGRIRLL